MRADTTRLHLREMPSVQIQFDFAPRTKIKISEAMSALKRERVFVKPPSREYIVDLVLEGAIEGRRIGGIWWLYLDSFERWVRSLDEPEVLRRAA
jgi:hypothetical protein